MTTQEQLRAESKAAYEAAMHLTGTHADHAQAATPAPAPAR